DGGGEHQRVGDGAVVREVVLGQQHAVVAEALRLLRVLEQAPVDLLEAVLDAGPLADQKGPDPHRPSSLHAPGYAVAPEHPEDTKGGAEWLPGITRSTWAASSGRRSCWRRGAAMRRAASPTSACASWRTPPCWRPSSYSARPASRSSPTARCAARRG